MNKVYVIGKEVTDEVEKDRIEGAMCACEGSGNFVLLPDDSTSVKEGGKKYMVCTECGEFSHL